MDLPLLVTSYKNPDLDGTSCVYAYSEYLNVTGRPAKPAIFGTPHREAQWVMQKYGISPVADADKTISPQYKIALVDASDLGGISPRIDPHNVVEIIDHRKINQAALFQNASAQIELVGAAATLVAEKYHAKGIPITPASAILLYFAIVSNTINFQAKVTTERDRQMASWLRSFCEVPSNYVHDMFASKSSFTKPIKETFLDDFATFDMAPYKVGIAQLEMVGVDDFVTSNLPEIKKSLYEIKTEKQLSIVFLTCIDLEKAFNQLVAVDDKTETALEAILEVRFSDSTARRPGIIMRKEIVPLLKAYLSSKLGNDHI